MHSCCCLWLMVLEVVAGPCSAVCQAQGPDLEVALSVHLHAGASETFLSPKQKPIVGQITGQQAATTVLC